MMKIKNLKRKGLTFLITLSSLTLNSCSILMPYEENPACRKGNQTGLCGSITDIYNYYNQGYTIKDAEKLTEDKNKKNSGLCDGVLKNPQCPR